MFRALAVSHLIWIVLHLITIPYLFRFEELWLQDEECDEIVSNQWWCGDDEIGISLTKSFMSLFKTSNPISTEECTSLVENRVSTSNVEFLSKPYTREEVKMALFQMHPTKVPGEDDMPALFFYHYWDLMKLLLDRMENQQEKSINFETFTWKIENFSKQNTMNLRSKAFKIRDYKWRIHLYPLRKDVNHFSLYLMVADSLPSYGWSRNTYFKLALINQVDSNKSLVKETKQKFNGGYRSWGSPFLNLSDFLDNKQGYLVNNTCIIEAHISVSDVALINTNVQANNLSQSTSNNASKSGDQETESSDESEPRSSITCESSQSEQEARGSDLRLRDLLDFEKLKLPREEMAYIPLLEEACIWHSSLIISQKKKSELFKAWAFISLGKVLHFLKTKKVKDMDENVCDELRDLWEELKSSGFDLAWLEPHVQSALGAKAHLEKTMTVKKLQDDVVAMEIKMKKLRGELAATEAEFEVARKALVEARKDFTEIDFNAELGYAMF
ncbi:hypothetical protein RIF29_39542 [Crotalaria pallida]|uniref:MATH domain-containing protein n=1 Tax=Crotalaria pallida TaxID=3830 RepID=A0AAN9E283_CROPI